MATFNRIVSALVFAGGAALSIVAMSAPAIAQVPQPGIPDINRRSGLIGRYIPIEPHLPPDPKRDDWYDTRYGDAPNLRKHPNCYQNGGLYGLRWRSTCVRSISPFFFGAPGGDTFTEDCRPCHPWLRLSRAVVHPFKPIGMYYDQGSYVPIYDLDPIVPGPGPWPMPFYRKITNFGG
jgi:hypothetical protein